MARNRGGCSGSQVGCFLVAFRHRCPSLDIRKPREVALQIMAKTWPSLVPTCRPISPLCRLHVPLQRVLHSIASSQQQPILLFPSKCISISSAGNFEVRNPKSACGRKYRVHEEKMKQTDAQLSQPLRDVYFLTSEDQGQSTYISFDAI